MSVLNEERIPGSTAQRPSRSGTRMEVGYHGKWHRRALLLAVRQAAADASQSRARRGRQAVAKLKGYEFGGHYDAACDHWAGARLSPSECARSCYRLHRVQQSRCAGGGQTHARARTDSCEETAL